MPRLPYTPHSMSFAKPTFMGRVARRLNGLTNGFEQRAWALSGFGALVNRVIELDRDDGLYLRHLREPLLTGNKLPDRSRWIARWHEIFEQAPA
jgi:hypothetical protein